ncbi:hypothetical protein BT69DRAFT_1238330 [Atractiella rhizophila]|nr:hypothetical protein BT69DRAFT_1238330 [Atractiella rhizophila]
MASPVSPPPSTSALAPGPASASASLSVSRSLPQLNNQGRSYQSFHLNMTPVRERERERNIEEGREEGVVDSAGGGGGVDVGSWTAEEEQIREGTSQLASLSLIDTQAHRSASNHSSGLSSPTGVQSSTVRPSNLTLALKHHPSTSTLAAASTSASPIVSGPEDEEAEEEEEEVKVRGLPPVKVGTVKMVDERTPLLGYSNDKPSVSRRMGWREKLSIDWRQPFAALPAVLLGTLMNVLDGVSYGLITFPTNIPIFANFGGIGVSMFFVSCIISQLTYTLGGSLFVSGNGSMMIEVVPFLHVMVDTIMSASRREDEVVPTTMVAFALSSILTGLTFYILGAAKLGTLIGFFPRSVLIGCIGGVGAFLFITGLEVSARLEDESVEFSLETVRHFFELAVLPLWTVPLALATLLRLITYKFSHPLIFTGYFIVIPIIFYAVVLIIGTPLATLREKGWVFELEGVDTPFYEYWTYFDFGKTNVPALLKTLPTQFALVFFALLHVPINVPSLGISIGEDNVDTNRELRAHGISNFLSGAAGSVPNYLCYVNSVLFYRVGGDTRVAGVLLAAASTGVLIAGPKIIGFLPVMVVGALIYVLGFDLMKEALWDTYGRVAGFEYFTIVAIVVVMTLWDFVVGIGAGIILACISFVITASQGSAIRAVMNGATARSTVRRHPKQNAFLKQVGSQTKILKLQGFLFFGTISKCEATMRAILDASEWTSNPVRYLIVDFTLASGVDFSAAEAFLRIKRQLDAKAVVLVFCGTKPESSIGKALRSVGLWAGESDGRVEVYATLNEALEHCENEYLRSLYSSGLIAAKATGSDFQSIGIDVPAVIPPQENLSSFHLFSQSPRRIHLQAAAHENLQISSEGKNLMQNFAQPLPLLLLSLKPFARQLDQSYFLRLIPYFQRVTIKRGDVLWNVNDEANSFYVIETGMLRAGYSFPTSNTNQMHNKLSETMLPGTLAGEFTFLSNIKRTVRVVAERDSVVWRMSRGDWDKLGTQAPEDQAILTQILLRCTQEEQEVLMTHLATTFRWPEL